MPANEMLQEAKKLHAMGDSLAVLADRNPPVEEALASSQETFITRPVCCKWWSR